MSHPVDEIKQILLASVDDGVRAVLDSKIHLLRLARAEALHAKVARVINAGQGEKTQAITEWWGAARIEAESTADKLIAACIAVGVADDELISKFVSTDLEHFLKSSASSLRATLSRGMFAMAYAKRFAALEVQAGPLAGRIPHKVRVCRFEVAIRQRGKDPREYSTEPQGLPLSVQVIADQEVLAPDSSMPPHDPPTGALLHASTRSAAVPAGAESVVRVLHLSDFHFRATTAWDASTVLGRLAADVAGLTRGGQAPDLVVLTGDIAHGGKAEEYALARAWILGELLPAAELGVERLVIAPGNHDVDWARIGKGVPYIADGLRGSRDEQHVTDVMAGEEGLLLLRRLDAFVTFVNELGVAGTPLTRPWYRVTHEIRGVRVHCAALTSAWLSADEGDHGKLLLGLWQCTEVLRGADDAHVVLAALHHPWSYMAEWDLAQCLPEIERSAGLVLRGHLHDPKYDYQQSPRHGGVLELAAGACYENSQYPNSYHLIEIRPDAPAERRARVYPRFWDRTRREWQADLNVFRGSSGELPLRVRGAAGRPAHSSAQGGESRAGARPSEQPQYMDERERLVSAVLDHFLSTGGFPTQRDFELRYGPRFVPDELGSEGCLKHVPRGENRPQIRPSLRGLAILPCEKTIQIIKAGDLLLDGMKQAYRSEDGDRKRWGLQDLLPLCDGLAEKNARLATPFLLDLPIWAMLPDIDFVTPGQLAQSVLDHPSLSIKVRELRQSMGISDSAHVESLDPPA